MTVTKTDEKQPEEKSSVLSQIRTGKIDKPRRCILYGVPGIGKSTWGSQWPSPIFIPTEDGCDWLDLPKFPVTKSYDQFTQYVLGLYTDKHDYKTLVIDSADWLEHLVRNKVCGEANVESIADIDFQKGFERASTTWGKKVLPACNALRDKRGMHILMIAHCKVEKFKAPDSDSYDYYTPRLHKHVNDLLVEWCDELLFARYETMTVSKEEGFGNVRTRAIGEGDRYIECNKNPASLAKNRLGMPDRIPMTFESYYRYWSGEPVAPEMSASQEQTTKQPF